MTILTTVQSVSEGGALCTVVKYHSVTTKPQNNERIIHE